jgi:peptide/nickel transport system substrate-binding protein
MKRRHFALSLPTLAAAHLPVLAQSGKSSMVLGMTLEPPGLDPTAARPPPSPRWCRTTSSRR